MENSVLIVHLGALGAVVRSTCLLELIHSQYAHAQVTWVTDKPADQLLRNHPLIDRVLTSSAEDLLALAALEFDVAFVIDKSLKASGILKSTSVKKAYGFCANPRGGGILPLTPAAVELWSLGLDDRKKFFVNQKSEQRLVAEALELRFDETPAYNLPLSESEKSLMMKRRAQFQMDSNQPVIGINTGCSQVLPAKKLTVQFQRELISELRRRGFENLVLLGGPEDRERNEQIALGLGVFQSPTDLGLRDGLVSVAACDIVVTGDSLGLHMAISQRKFTVAWFGPTCAQEIDLYGFGRKVLTKAACAPCWKRSCGKAEMCYDQVSLNEIIQAVLEGQSEIQNQWRQNEFLSFKQLSSGTCS